MLDACAPGHQRAAKTHNWWITYEGKTFHRLPLGPQSKRHNPPIQIGHVKQMVRLFEIVACAQEHIPRLQ